MNGIPYRKESIIQPADFQNENQPALYFTVLPYLNRPDFKRMQCKFHPPVLAGFIFTAALLQDIALTPLLHRDTGLNPDLMRASQALVEPKYQAVLSFGFLHRINQHRIGRIPVHIRYRKRRVLKGGAAAGYAMQRLV